MSLYNHVEDKEAILDGILEAVMAQSITRTRRRFGEDVRAGARAWRRLMLAHPNVIALFAESKHPRLRRSDSGPWSGRSIAPARRALRGEVVYTFPAIGGYIMGTALNEVANPVPGMSDRDHRAEHLELAATIPRTSSRTRGVWSRSLPMRS